MIIDGIYALFMNVAMWIIGLFPNTNIDFGSHGLSSYLGSANQFVNMPLLVAFVGSFVAYEAVVLTARLVHWIWMTLKP